MKYCITYQGWFNCYGSSICSSKEEYIRMKEILLSIGFTPVATWKIKLKSKTIANA